jgi:hypothetical protein
MEHPSGIGREFFARVRDRGWYDCVWDALGDEVQTWFGTGEIRRREYV